MFEHKEEYAGRKIKVLKEIVICCDNMNYKYRKPYQPGSILTITSWRPEGFFFPDGILFKRDFSKVELIPYYQQCRKCGTIYCSDIPVNPHAYCIVPGCGGLVPYENNRQDVLREEFGEKEGK